MEIKNAIIESAKIIRDDYGILSVWMKLDCDGYVQSFGGHELYFQTNSENHEIKSVAGHFLWRVMGIAGVTDWDKIRGRIIRVRSNNGVVEAIGHIVNDDWFYPRGDFTPRTWGRN